MSYTVTIYSDREKAEYRRKHFRPLDDVVTFTEGRGLDGLAKPPSNIQSAKEWFETCLWVVKNVRRKAGGRETGKRGLSEQEFLDYFRYCSASGWYRGIRETPAQVKADCTLKRKICKAMGWTKSEVRFAESLARIKAAAR